MYPLTFSIKRKTRRLFLLGIVTLSMLACSQTETEEVSIQKPQIKREIKAEEPRLKTPKQGKVQSFFDEYAKNNLEKRVILKTRLGDIELELFEETPIHRANFLFNVKNDLYSHTIFYRVVPDFMIQGGNSDHDQTLLKRKGVGAYYIPSERDLGGIHQRGAVAMAMTYDNNPEEKSAQYSYYIVIGTKFSDEGLDAVEEEYQFNIPEASRKIYKSIGGSPHLDGKHTVFGMVSKGMDIVEAIANEKRDSGDWPINDVIIECEIVE
ncbi:MAG: peptidylprolyl isomerase [Flavobacteriales bacterium]|jgi:peptidyl-prolyl cis-trans isomerase B (cyclophilin B)|nr:peptidylprolyl isomerase [Flavobacteriales bacterium]MBT3963008.1 peptidylprolyl isomerase [Flavobacteriales bacterium]MBT4929632.1 peptidylprolyl isomerase [Flavobacteriales bacterium]MBT5132926.1 peptidylprolyl isomerase [Flavobacteriales bacterium]MBT6383206.1 peptidylprolyl isomerase [Flavobacteriales bacterium]